MDYPEVDFVEQLAVLVNVYGGRPLVSDPKQKLGEQVLIHRLTVATVVDPLLGDLDFHFCIAVERGKHAVNAGEQLDV